MWCVTSLQTRQTVERVWGTSVAAELKDCDGSSYSMTNQEEGILKRELNPDSPGWFLPLEFYEGELCQ